MNHLKFTKDELDVHHLSQLVGSPTGGAMLLLTGTIRDTFEEEVVGIFDYNAYTSIGIDSLEKICSEIRTRWPSIENIAIFHRIEIDREINIGIAISSFDRKDAIYAIENCMDEVTRNIPIWKREVFAKQASERKEKMQLASHPPRITFFKTEIEPQFQQSPIPRHLVQIHASNSEINKRIEDFMAKKRDEINITNIREFTSSDGEAGCARVDAVFRKRPDSKSHLQVKRMMHAFWKDQKSTEYLAKHIPRDGVGERLRNLELHLNVPTPIDASVYTRLNNLETRLQEFQGVSPEYIEFWQVWNRNKESEKPIKKKVWTVQDIEIAIVEVEKKIREEKKQKKS